MNFASIDSVFPSPFLILFLHLPFSGREEKAPWISQLWRQHQILPGVFVTLLHNSPSPDLILPHNSWGFHPPPPSADSETHLCPEEVHPRA